VAGEVQKLEKQALRDFRDATHSEWVASGEHGIPARLAAAVAATDGAEAG
jgi:hypothetical protein